MKPASYLAFHLSLWTTIAVVLFFSGYAHSAELWSLRSSYQNCKGASYNYPSLEAWMTGKGAIPYGEAMALNEGFNATGNCWEMNYNVCQAGMARKVPLQQNSYGHWLCTDNAADWQDAQSIDCKGGSWDPNTGTCSFPVPAECQVPSADTDFGAAYGPESFCFVQDGCSASQGWQLESNVSGGVNVSVDQGVSYSRRYYATGEYCSKPTGEEPINPNYDLPVMPTTGEAVEINGEQIPLVKEGCGHVGTGGTSIVCTNKPNCGEFNGEWLCTGPDSGTEGVPATPDLEYSVTGTTNADRAGDQYFYNSTTVSNSTNLGTGTTADPTTDGSTDRPSDGSYTGDPNAPLGQGSCPSGYVQTGITSLGDGSTEAHCEPQGESVDWMGWFDKLNFADDLPDEWLQTPNIPGLGGSGGTCPAPKSLTAFGTTYEISFQPFCDLAGMLRPMLILLAYLAAGWFVFRIVGGGDK